jgi:hypothetical protein
MKELSVIKATSFWKFSQKNEDHSYIPKIKFLDFSTSTGVLWVYTRANNRQVSVAEHYFNRYSMAIGQLGSNIELGSKE